MSIRVESWVHIIIMLKYVQQSPINFFFYPFCFPLGSVCVIFFELLFRIDWTFFFCSWVLWLTITRNGKTLLFKVSQTCIWEVPRPLPPDLRCNRWFPNLKINWGPGTSGGSGKWGTPQEASKIHTYSPVCIITWPIRYRWWRISGHAAYESYTCTPYLTYLFLSSTLLRYAPKVYYSTSRLHVGFNHSQPTTRYLIRM